MPYLHHQSSVDIFHVVHQNFWIMSIQSADAIQSSYFCFPEKIKNQRSP